MTNFDRVVGLMGASVVAIACASPAMAQTRTYSIPAQSASSGVAALARQSDQQVLISARDAKGKKTREVRGEMTIEQAFARLLAGSGLTAKRTGAGAWAVVQGGNAAEEPARDEGSEAFGSTSVSANASTIVDARTGAALKGALVEIVETGEKTSTGNLGEFRFPGKNGSFSLRISYLGYPEYQQFVDLKDGRATSGIILSDGSAEGEIVVTAYQSARAQALNQERTAENSSTVVSADLLGQFDGNTISDALRRSPGVSFIVDPTTGDGANVVIRGLAPEFNTIEFNGLRIPVGDGNGDGRAPALSNILADSISKITINKTLLPSQDGTGTGGLVQIETKAPLDRPDRYFSASIEKATIPKSFLDETGASGTASWRFGESRNFGASVSVQYRKRQVEQVALTQTVVHGQYLPKDQNGVPIRGPGFVSLLENFPYEPGVDDVLQTGFGFGQSSSTTENLSFTGALQWQIGTHTNLRLDYNRSTVETEQFERSTGINASGAYVLMPIPELNGEERYAYVWEAYGPNLFASISRSAGAQEFRQKTSTLSFVGKTELDRWTFNYKAGYAKGGSDYDPKFVTNLFGSTAFTRDDLSPEVSGNTINGRVRSIAPLANASNIPLPGFNQSGFDKIDAINDFFLYLGSTNGGTGENERITSGLDIKYEPNIDFLNYIQVGAYFEDSSNSNDPVFGYEVFTSALPGDLGLTTDSSVLGRIGISNQLRTLSDDAIRGLWQSVRARSNPLLDITDRTVDDPRQFQDGITEQTLAAYAQFSLTLGKFDIVGGVRMEKVQTNADVGNSITFIDEFGNFDQAYFDANYNVTSIRASDTSFLPRLTINYRPTKNSVIRLGYYNVYARPSLPLLSTYRSVDLYLLPFFGPAGNQPLLSINDGNPGLKSAITHSFDLSFELYDENVGVMKAGFFYKPTRRSIQSNRGSIVKDLETVITMGVLPNDPRFQNLPSNIYIGYSRPENSKDTAKLWGAEFALERRFAFLPGALSGLGVFANYTYTDSSMVGEFYDQSIDDFRQISGVPYSGQPKHSGTLALTYSKYGVDASIGYTMQGRYKSIFAPRGLSQYRESISSLDLKVQYRTKAFGADLNMFLEGSNLLKGTEDPGLRTSVGGEMGSPKYILSDNFFGGRSIRLGLSASF